VVVVVSCANANAPESIRVAPNRIAFLIEISPFISRQLSCQPLEILQAIPVARMLTRRAVEILYLQLWMSSPAQEISLRIGEL
jgi:hypothetical protein